MFAFLSRYCLVSFLFDTACLILCCLIMQLLQVSISLLMQVLLYYLLYIVLILTIRFGSTIVSYPL